MSMKHTNELQKLGSETLPIPRRKLADEVHSRLVARISAGEFGPGEHLPSERELMSMYGVGRPSVREALQGLERAGIVVISHGERARITVPTANMLINQIASGARHVLSMDPAMLDHLKDARLFLEVGIARQAAERVREAGIEALEAAHAAHVEALNELDVFVRRDMTFHREIARMTGNPIYPALIEAMFDWLGEYYGQLVRVPGAEALTLEEHARILAAIRDNNPEEAGHAMHDHLSRANSLYLHFAQTEHRNGADK
ncbi:transcriptional regulator NanR [uncultured Jannaschia sp.]|uniref:transcriptional regulator NanR n=1 Tax=uncultured Jannaschia sp. TaxID=293347 RepID=UPI00262B08B1|nr:transcriptional regulator NanR [uncultured Jannaschia sp.]